jgi:hypothetical protein
MSRWRKVKKEVSVPPPPNLYILDFATPTVQSGTMRNLTMISSHQLNQPSSVENLNSDVDDSNPIKYMKPIFTCMAIVGVQAGICIPQSETDTMDPDRRKLWDRIGLLWSITTAVLVWANIIRLTTSYTTVSGFNENTFIRVVLFVWFLRGGINSIVCLRATIKRNMLHKLYSLWSTHSKQLSFNKNMSSVKKIVWLLTGYYIVFVVINIALISYVLYSDDPVLVPFRHVLFTPFGDSEGFKLFLVLFQAYVAGTWLLPLWLFLLVSIVNKYMLEDTTASLLEHTDEETQHFNGDLENVRMDYEAACDMVECADDTFSLFVGLGLAIDMPMTCFVMYMMIWPNIKSTSLAFNGCLLVMHIFHLCLIMWSAARVHSEVCAAEKTPSVCYICMRW